MVVVSKAGADRTGYQHDAQWALQRYTTMAHCIGEQPSPHHLRDTVQAVVAMKVRLRVSRRVGRDVTRRLRADLKKVKTRAHEALPVSLSVAKAS
jgi:hypothetical protein